MQIMFKKLSEDAIIPTHGSKYAAGYDLYVTEDGVIPSGESVMFHTGLAMSIPNGYYGAIVSRSGLSTKQGIRPSTCCSTIDADYIGEVGIPLYNDSREPRTVKKGDRVAQLIILPCQTIEWVEVEELTATDRGEGGYGSTGTR